MQHERVDAKTFLAELARKPTAKGSTQTFGGWEPRDCYVCGERVLAKSGCAGFSHVTGEARSWHWECGPRVVGFKWAAAA